MPSLTPIAALERGIDFLAPLFLPATKGDVAAARQAARETLMGYRARTESEFRLAALAVAFSFGSLSALGAAATADIELKLRLQRNAIGLSKAGHANQALLDAAVRAGMVGGPAGAGAGAPPGRMRRSG